MIYKEIQKKILITAEKLIQTNGFNAFSYKDIANTIGIKNSSIHYYYASKDDLGVAVIEWSMANLYVSLDKIKKNKKLSPKEKLLEFVDFLFGLTYRNKNKMCLGGMFASDVLSLSEKIKSKIQKFFSYLLQWVEEVSAEDINMKKDQQIRRRFSKQLIAQIEGGLLLIRIYKDEEFLDLMKVFIEERCS